MVSKLVSRPQLMVVQKQGQGAFKVTQKEVVCVTSPFEHLNLRGGRVPATIQIAEPSVGGPLTFYWKS